MQSGYAQAGYGRPASLPRALNCRGGSSGNGENGSNADPSSPSKLGEQAELKPEPAQQMQRPQTANSNFSSVELLDNDGDGRPGFERCGGRATAEQQGVAQKPAGDAPSWDLSVNVSNAQAQPPAAAAPGPAEKEGGGKKWWKPSMPFGRGGNRGGSSSPRGEMPPTMSTNAVATESVAAFDRSNVRTPDSVERTFHGPNRRAAPRLGASGRPPVPERRSPGLFEDGMPGGIVDFDAPPALPRPTSGGSGSGRCASVPARQPSPGRRAQSPSRVAPAPAPGALGAPSSPQPWRSAAAFGGFESGASLPSAQPRGGEETTVCAFGVDSPSPLGGGRSSGPSPAPVETFKSPSPAPNLARGESPAPDAAGGEKRGGRRGWRPWRRSGGDAGGASEAPRQETSTPVGSATEVSAFAAED